MPYTTTASWPDLVAGKKAKASEVEAKFDWLEGNLYPMLSGTTYDLTYNLGASDKQWKQAWVGGLNPTSTAAGVAIGKELAGSSTCLDLSAMPKAMLLPIVTTVQQSALTATAGMIVYNSTNARMERYEGGQWLAMNNPYGLVEKVKATNATTSFTEVINLSTSGNVKKVSLNPAGGDTHYLYMVVDGTSLNTVTTAAQAATISSLSFDPKNTTATFMSYGSTATDFLSTDLNASFKSTIIVYHRSVSTTSVTTALFYEAA